MRLSPLGSIYHLEIIPRYWFLEYLLIAYALFYFIIKYCSKHTIIIMGIIGVISFISMNNLRAEQSFSFLAGILFSQNKLLFEKMEKKQLITFAFLFFVVGITALLIKQLPQLRIYDLESIQFKSLNLLIKLPLGISLLLMLFAISPNGIRWIIPFGNMSYELYLTHVSFFMSIAGCALYLIVFIVQTVLLAYIIHYLNKFILNKITLYG